jgi:large subunit ribosomal protein L25
MKELKRMLKGHCSNNVISVKINKDIIDCIVKDLQSDSVTGEIIHIDLQTVDKNRYVKLKVPVKFKGKEKLQAQGLVLQVIKPEITVKGSIDLIPDSISVNVEDKKLGDHVIIQDCQINKNLKVLSEPNILAIVVSQDKMDMVS